MTAKEISSEGNEFLVPNETFVLDSCEMRKYLIGIETEEIRRQNESIELIASENYPSIDVLNALGSPLAYKYAEGYPAKRYYGGCEVVDKAEETARHLAKELFKAEHANVQPHSGTQANMAAYAAFLKPGDTILAPSMDAGGHLTHSSPVSFVTHTYNVVTYGVKQDGDFCYYDIGGIAKECKPKLIVIGCSAHTRELRYDYMRMIADEVGAYLMADMAHVAGLVAAGYHMSPVPYCDVVTSTTQKTLRGPRGGLILCKKEYAKAVDKAVFPYSQGGPHMNSVLAKAFCFNEARTDMFREYIGNVVSNCKAMEEVFRSRGIEMVTDGTDNHMLLLDLKNAGVTGKQLERALMDIGIVTNKNCIPFDKQSPSVTSGLRIGTAAMTSRGFTKKNFETVANTIADCILTLNTGDFNGEKHKQEMTRLAYEHPVKYTYLNAW